MTKEIINALCEFIKEVPSLSTLSTAKIQTNNGKGYEFEFMELGYICSVINPILAEKGLHIYHIDETIDGKEYLLSTIYHTSGESLPTSKKLYPKGFNKNILYDYGSAKTYFRRYVTLGMLNLWEGVDDAGYQYEPNEDNENKKSSVNTNTANTYEETNENLSKKDIELWKEELRILYKISVLEQKNTKYNDLNKDFCKFFGVKDMPSSIKTIHHAEFIKKFIQQPDLVKQ